MNSYRYKSDIIVTIILIPILQLENDLTIKSGLQFYCSVATQVNERACLLFM